MCRIAKELTNLTPRQIMFDGLDYSDEFDGIWACASLLHVDKNTLPDILRKLSKALKTNGVAFLLFKYGNFSGMRNGRFYIDINKSDLSFICSGDTGLALLEWSISEDSLPEKRNVKWLNTITQKII